MAGPVELYDTTLRDGAQSEGISLSLEDKLQITRLLDELGLDYIEGGWPGSNPKDAAYFRRVKALSLRHATVTAFSYTRRAQFRAEDDPNLHQLLAAETEVVTVVGKTWLLHVHHVLRVSPEENLSMIRETLAYLRGKGRRVIYDAEHFFDGYRADPDYALRTLEAAVEGGAETLVLCDTNGGAMYWEVEDVTRRVVAAFPKVRVGIHTHNDAELAVANTLAAVRAGAQHVQGTINGYGERVGNANLVSLLPNLKLKMGLDVVSDAQLRRLTEIAHTVSEICNIPPNPYQPYVGRSAFAHKAGIHADATLKHMASYQHIDPNLVGNHTRVLISELSGKGNILYKLQQWGMERGLSREKARSLVQVIKDLEAQGFTFEAAEASMQLLLRRQEPDYRPPFELVDFMVVVEHRKGRGVLAEATVKVRVGRRLVHTAAEGNGPVHALDRALRKALMEVYPQVASMELVDYKVRILDGERGTAAKVRVLIDSKGPQGRWSTVGASTNIIQASWQALADSVEYFLWRDGASTRQ